MRWSGSRKPWTWCADLHDGAMKIAAISDIHGNLAALQAVLEDIASRAVDQIVNLGDILSGPLQPAATADLLMAKDFVTIAGNHERQLLKLWDGPAAIDQRTSDGYAATKILARHAQWLRALATFHWLQPDVLLVHGAPAGDLVYWLETVTPDLGVNGSPGLRAATPDEVRQRLEAAGDADPASKASLVLCGHTHVPRAVQCGPTLIVNPGSVGLQAYEDTHPYPHRAENGSPDARYALLERRSAGWQVELRAVPYDWQPQARLADEHGRADWAYALATGRMPVAPTIAP
jgi:predicted phosphodiesterase